MVELQVPAGTQSMVDQFLHILIHGFIGGKVVACDPTYLLVACDPTYLVG